MYRVLYRKYRPQTLSDVTGQPQVTITLKNELKNGRINHAYLFTGSRGTGKTSCAKILAKAVNCLNSIDGDPCGICESCKGIDSGNILDVVEIDAASNNGVDNIRELREEAVFAPTKAKFRVYIIDEVHMLSQGAFNALLKTLEEPPAHVIFILATTEVHKLPETILSRCQRFDFHRIAPNDIADRLRFVAKEENITATDEALLMIASIADGGMRDALSLFDRCIGIDNNVTVDIVTKAAGLAGNESIFALSKAIFEKDVQAALAIIDTLYGESKNMLRLSEELVSFFRNFLLIKTVKNPQDFFVMSEADLQKAKEIVTNISLSEIIYCMDTLLSSAERMSKGSNARIEIEVSVFKLCSPEASNNTEAILSRISALERAFRSGNIPNISENEQDFENQQESNVNEEIANISKKHSSKAKNISPTTDTQTVMEQEKILVPTTVDLDELRKSAKPMAQWHEVLEILKRYSKTISASFEGTTAYISGDYLLIDAQNEIPFKLLRQSAQRDKMRLAIKEVTGRNYKLGPYSKPEEAQNNTDPLNDFTAGLKELGIDVITD
ncbi:MAG: DNA polymerase III subunit gamma/tau [Bacillota bacterium]|nr:DNA polymerase III subunit gamma/tau [Bacillota bacterium]